MHNPAMYIIAIGWLYVTLLIAVNERSVFLGIISFVFYGLLPCGILLWMSASKVRRQRRAYREMLAQKETPKNPSERSGRCSKSKKHRQQGYARQHHEQCERHSQTHEIDETVAARTDHQRIHWR